MSLIRIIIAATRKFIMSRKIPRILATRRGSEAWFENGFIHCEPWERLCRRYVRSTECLSSCCCCCYCCSLFHVYEFLTAVLRGCPVDRGPGSFDVEDATTLSWSSAAVSEWVSYVVDNTKVLCPLFDKLEILIPGDSLSIFPSLDKMWNFNSL